MTLFFSRLVSSLFYYIVFVSRKRTAVNIFGKQMRSLDIVFSLFLVHTQSADLQSPSKTILQVENLEPSLRKR